MKIVAAIPAYNEEAILKNCLDHYSAFCDKVVLWDNESTDLTAAIARTYPNVEVRSFHSEGYDELTVLKVLGQSIVEARGVFDWILLPDSDEIVCLRDGGDMRSYLENSSADYLTCTGYCFAHSPDEPPLDLDRPFMYQRRYGVPCGAYDKPMIFRPSAPISLCPGKHDVAKRGECKAVKDQRLVLLHHEMVDWQLYVYRKNRRPLSADNVKYGLSVRRFCRPLDVIALHWRTIVGQVKDLRETLPVIRPPEVQAIGETSK